MFLSWVDGRFFSLVNAEKYSHTMFVCVWELQTPKPEHGCKIKTDHFFWLAN